MKEEEKESAPYNSLLVEETSLHRVSELINSLISSSYSIRCFFGKWQFIRDKLEELLSGVTSASDSNFSNGSSEFSAFLKSIVSTLNDVDVLLLRCADESYNGGKLLMRSDLDAVASMLQLHNKKLPEIYASGISSHSQDIILSKPGASASPAEMRFFVKDLFSRLKIGEASTRTRALDALHEMLLEDEKYSRIVALEIAEGIALLVHFIECGDTSIQEGATGVVSVIAEFNSYRGALVTAGVIAPLIQILEKGTEVGKERAAQALRKLTEKGDNVWSVSAHGGVTVLLKICSDPDSSRELVVLACKILRNLSSIEEIKRFMVEEGAVSVLIQLSRSKDETSQVQAIDFILAIASEDDSIRQHVVRKGIIMSLIQLLDSNSSYSPKAREVALRATELLCFSSANSLNVLLSSNFLKHLLVFLKSGEISIEELALKLLSHLTEISVEYRKVLGDAGFMPELVSLLEAKSFEVRVIAAEVLRSMVSIQQNRRRLIQDDNNVNQIMKLLNPDDEKSPTKMLLLSVLLLLADSNSGKRKILASNYVRHLEKLAEANVPDAKKVMKKLTGNRFRSILNGIWS